MNRVHIFSKFITRDNSADGLASAMIALTNQPHLEVRFMQYGTAEHNELPAENGMVFCGITPPRERVREFVDAGCWCLDHHESARDIVEAFGCCGRVGHRDASAALLAYASLSKNEPSLLGFAELVAIVETSQEARLRWHDALDLHALLVTLPRDWWLDRARRQSTRAIWWALEAAPDLGHAIRVESKGRANRPVDSSQRASDISRRLVDNLPGANETDSRFGPFALLSPSIAVDADGDVWMRSRSGVWGCGQLVSMHGRYAVRRLANEAEEILGPLEDSSGGIA